MSCVVHENLVDLSGEKSNQIFDELASWEEILKGSSLARVGARCATTVATTTMGAQQRHASSRRDGLRPTDA
jgi:hypothetical protein